MKSIFLAAMLVVSSACTGLEPREPPSASELAAKRGYVLGEEVQFIQDYDVHDWLYSSNRSVIIPSRPGKSYLLMLDRDCGDLRTADAIGFTSTVGRLRSRFDAVIVRDHPSGTQQICFIERIYELSKAKRDPDEE